MKRIAPHLSQSGALVGNVWLHQDTQGQRFLIDTGHPVERLMLLADLWSTGVRMKGDLTGILLTHRHVDHAGNAAWLRSHFGARVYCHAADAEILTGRKIALPQAEERPALHKAWLRKLGDRFHVATEIDGTYDEGAWKWGFRVFPVPGHTEGSVLLLHEPSGTLFTGDSIRVSHSLLRRFPTSLRLADPAFCLEPTTSHRSVRRFLADLPRVEVICPGHGPAIDERARQKLEKLARETGAIRQQIGLGE